MFCGHCGKEIQENAKFCTKCGAKVDEPSSVVQLSMDVIEANDKISRLKKIKGVLFSSKGAWIGGGLLALTAITTLSIGLIRNNNQIDLKKSEESTIDSGDSEDQFEVSQLAEQNGVELLETQTQEGNLQEKILTFNQEGYGLPYIDVYANNYDVPERDYNNVWDYELFYTLEGLISESQSTNNGYYHKDRCKLVKKELVNAATNNIMDYEIYINPDNGVANKIVSIEYLGDGNGIEVTEFYFDNNKKVNFVFQYKTDNYVSMFAMISVPGHRYQYNNDGLVTWREVNADAEQMNYTVGDASSERLLENHEPNEVLKYKYMSDELKKNFDEAEVKMLNAAYNTYNTLMNTDSISCIQGFVYDASSNPIEDAAVELYTSDFSDILYQGNTDLEGKYVIYVPSEAYEYNISVKKEGLLEEKLYGISVDDDQIGSYQDRMYLFEDEKEADVNLTLGDARNYNSTRTGMLLLDNAQVYVRRGINNCYGDIFYTGNTDGEGRISMRLPNGVYTIEVSADNYETMYYTVTSNNQGNNEYAFYTPPALNADEYVVVLTWGLYPYDLDSHLFTRHENSTEHIWYSRKNDSLHSNLDVDDTSSYGPETITIKNYDSQNNYKYCVVDFTNCSESDFHSCDMTTSNAVVNVYSTDGLVGTFHVPSDRAGVIWEVFEIRNGKITPIQRYYDSVEDKTWWNSDK